MKRWLMIFALALFLRPAVGLCALVQAVGSDLGHIATGHITIAATTAHSTIVVEVAIGAGTVSSVVVGASTSSTADKTIAFGGGTGQVAIFSVPDVAAGITTVTINLSATEWTCAAVMEESGLVTGGASNLDQANATAQAGGLTTWNSGNVTTTQASEVAYGYNFYPNAATVAWTPDTGWSLVGTTNGFDANGQVHETTDSLTIMPIRRVLSSTGTYAASGTGPSDQFTAGIATYKVATGGSCTHACYTSQFLLGQIWVFRHARLLDGAILATSAR